MTTAKEEWKEDHKKFLNQRATLRCRYPLKMKELNAKNIKKQIKLTRYIKDETKD